MIVSKRVDLAIARWLAGPSANAIVPVARQVFGAAERSEYVLVLVDRVRPDIVNLLSEVTAAQSVIVCAVNIDKDEFARSALVLNAEIVTIRDQIDLHRLLAVHGKPAVIVDALTMRSSGLCLMMMRLFISAIQGGGYYVVLDGAASGDSGRTIAPLVSYATSTVVDGRNNERDLDDDDYIFGAQIDSVTVSSGGMVLSKVGNGFAKLRHGEVDSVLQGRYGADWGRRLEVTRGRRIEFDVVRTTNRRDLCSKRFPQENRIPECSVREYRNVCVVPRQIVIKDDLLLPDTFRWGEARRLRNTALRDLNHYYATLPESIDEAPLISGEYFHLDLEYNKHFGHFMTEAIPRLYGWDAAREAFPEVRILTNSHSDGGRPATYQRDLLEAYGISQDRIHVIDSPVKVERLVCARPLFENMRFADPRLAQTYSRIRQGLLESVGVSPGKPVRKIFVSRRRGMWRECTNSDELERFFSSRGFEIIRPEGHSIAEQARIFSEARVVAGYIGSALYNIMFAASDIDVVGFVNESYVATNEFLISSVMGHRLHMFFGNEFGKEGRSKDVDGRPVGGTNSDYFFDLKRNGPQLEDLLDRIG